MYVGVIKWEENDMVIHTKVEKKGKNDQEKLSVLQELERKDND